MVSTQVLFDSSQWMWSILQVWALKDDQNERYGSKTRKQQMEILKSPQSRFLLQPARVGSCPSQDTFDSTWYSLKDRWSFRFYDEIVRECRLSEFSWIWQLTLHRGPQLSRIETDTPFHAFSCSFLMSMQSLSYKVFQENLCGRRYDPSKSERFRVISSFESSLLWRLDAEIATITIPMKQWYESTINKIVKYEIEI